mmetsp:Transcript_21604/g.71529  ORF Transcript_21604/g.71529 Transcript_21604/m.71529 type:complete len:209 (+) Transcript_21604:45-671(+)
MTISADRSFKRSLVSLFPYPSVSPRCSPPSVLLPCAPSMIPQMVHSSFEAPLAPAQLEAPSQPPPVTPVRAACKEKSEARARAQDLRGESQHHGAQVARERLHREDARGERQDGARHLGRQDMVARHRRDCEGGGGQGSGSRRPAGRAGAIPGGRGEGRRREEGEAGRGGGRGWDRTRQALPGGYGRGAGQAQEERTRGRWAGEGGGG